MKAHRCSHCRAGRQNVRNVRGEKINPFSSSFCQSVALSVFGIVLICLSKLHCYICSAFFLELSCLIIWTSTLISCACTNSQKEISHNRTKWIYLCYNFKNSNMHSVMLFEIVMWQMNCVANKTVLCYTHSKSQNAIYSERVCVKTV